MITGKCAILITHRLSAVQLADKVAVFDDGQVAEYGTHTSFTPRAASTPKCSINRRNFIVMNLRKQTVKPQNKQLMGE